MKPSALPTMHLLCSHLYIFLRHAASPPLLVPSLGLVSLSASLEAASLPSLAFWALGCPVPPRPAAQQSGLSPLSSGGGPSIQALFMFAMDQEALLKSAKG